MSDTETTTDTSTSTSSDHLIPFNLSNDLELLLKPLTQTIYRMQKLQSRVASMESQLSFYSSSSLETSLDSIPLRHYGIAGKMIQSKDCYDVFLQMLSSHVNLDVRTNSRTPAAAATQFGSSS